MLDAVAEFPFVEKLPKREKSRLAKAWDLFERMKAETAVHGQLVPLVLTAKLLNVGPSRIDQFVRDDRLTRVEIDGHVFITENSIVEFAKIERKNGRPLKLPKGAKEVWQLVRSS